MVRKRGRVGTCGGDVLSSFWVANGVMGKLREGVCASVLDGHRLNRLIDFIALTFSFLRLG